LGKALSRLPGTISAGEVFHLWSRGLHENQRCGCGQPFHDCAFWREVGDRAFGGWSNIDAQSILELKASVDRQRFLPWLIQDRAPSAYQAALVEYVDVLTRLYSGIRDTSGCMLIVDTSKSVSMAWLLRRAPELDVRVIHLVRDSRGVAFSWKKRVRRPEITERVEYMPEVPAAKLALHWNTTNAGIQLLSLTRTPVLRIRYEDLVEMPAPVMGKVASFAGLEFGDVERRLFSSRQLERAADHEVSGNPMRFAQGPIRLQSDDMWRTQLGSADQRVVGLLTCAGLHAYGYCRRPRSSPGLAIT